jgi:PAS domain S-box-containing protein
LLYQKFKQQLLAIGISLVIICVLIIGAFFYNYHLSREIDEKHLELANVARAFYYHADYVMEYTHNPETARNAPTIDECNLGMLLQEIKPVTQEAVIYHEKIDKVHEKFHQTMVTGSLEDIVIVSQELHAALGQYNLYLTDYIGKMETTRTNVIVAVALPGLVSIVALLGWLYIRMYRLIQNRIARPLNESLEILTKAGLYSAYGEDEPENILRAVTKASQIIEVDNARLKLYPFWNSVFTEEELLNGSLELFGDNQLVASAAFYRYDSFTDELTVVASYAFPKNGEHRVPFGVGPIGEAAKKQKPVMVEQPGLELSLGFATAQPPLLAFYPVVCGQQLYGVLAFAFQKEITPEQMTIVEFFAVQLGIVMDRVRQLDALKKMTWELGNRTKALNKELRYRDSILSSSADGIVILSTDGVISLFSKGAENITGYSAREAMGARCCDIFRHRDNNFNILCDTKNCANCAIQTQKVPIIGKEVYIQRKDDQFVPILLSATPLFNDQGEVIEILQIFKDVTDLRNTFTQLEQANRSKTEFLATMSHELRTPLNAILGFAELLETESFGPLNDRQKRYTANILTAGKHLLSLINDILDITRVESGKVEWEYAPMDVAQVFGSAVSLLREKAVQNQLKLSLEIEPGFNQFTGDERKIKQILYNLINNAVKFTPSGGNVGVNVTRRQEDMLITVWDTGIGIPPDKRDAIFEPFYQVDNYLTRSQQGSGLGLALVKKMVELAGGRIWLADEQGRSTVIKVLLPPSPTKKPIDSTEEVAKAEIVDQVAAEEVSKKLSSGRGNLAVVVEDDMNSVELLEAYLRDMGYSTLPVPTGEEGIAAIESKMPDLVVLDVLLPGMSGWEMLAAIKSNPALAHIPVIVVSILEEREKGLALGAVDYLTKPIERSRLINCVQKAVGRSINGRCRALVIDDDTKALELFNDYLTGMGIDVYLAPDPREGFKIAKEIVPDILFLDLIMPGIDGFAFLEQKDKEPILKDIPVVVITSKSLTVPEKEFLEQRVEHVARKSQFGREAFEAVVKRIAGRGV